ncbi:hypothetical protein G6F22_019572 [Rhizopus arrhizus]|nr:hypothetical protein G6F22_019572 [Rhizopus arrhizus]
MARRQVARQGRRQDGGDVGEEVHQAAEGAHAVRGRGVNHDSPVDRVGQGVQRIGQGHQRNDGKHRLRLRDQQEAQGSGQQASGGEPAAGDLQATRPLEEQVRNAAAQQHGDAGAGTWASRSTAGSSRT